MGPLVDAQVLPGASPDTVPMLALTAIAALLVVVAAGITVHRRDIA